MLRICVAIAGAVSVAGLIVAGSGLAQDQPPAKAQASGSALTAQEVEELVNFHNKVRKEVGVGPVKWSSSLAKVAQEWADGLAESGQLKHRPRIKGQPGYGENLAVGPNVLVAAGLWYGEIKNYQAGTAIPKDFGSFKAGHYTQMVWKKTTEIGAGKAVIKQGRFKGMLVLVCNYNPPGNMPGEKPY